MAPGLMTEPLPVVKERKGKAAADSPPVEFGRIELQAPPEWIDFLDAVAKAMGMSRSAYIRQACNLRLSDDCKTLGSRAPRRP
jgi:hypothetical protein